VPARFRPVRLLGPLQSAVTRRDCVRHLNMLCAAAVEDCRGCRGCRRRHQEESSSAFFTSSRRARHMLRLAMPASSSRFALSMMFLSISASRWCSGEAGLKCPITTITSRSRRRISVVAATFACHSACWAVVLKYVNRIVARVAVKTSRVVRPLPSLNGGLTPNS
jgi:hypothetical protein